MPDGLFVSKRKFWDHVFSNNSHPDFFFHQQIASIVFLETRTFGILTWLDKQNVRSASASQLDSNSMQNESKSRIKQETKS